MSSNIFRVFDKTENAVAFYAQKLSQVFKVKPLNLMMSYEPMIWLHKIKTISDGHIIWLKYRMLCVAANHIRM